METKKRWYKQGAELLDEIKSSSPGAGTAHVWFLGQHGFTVSLGGLVIYIDVILNPLPGSDGVDQRLYSPPFTPDYAGRIDYFMCTHGHDDHLNLETIVPLAKKNPACRFIVPEPCRPILKGAGIEENRIVGARAGEVLELNAASNSKTGGKVSVVPVPAVHTRYIEDEGEKDEKGNYTSLGFVILGGGVSIYHSGDTWITPGLVSALKSLGPIDIALLPINGTDWERTGRNCVGNVSVMDAVKLAMAVPIDLVIPSHYDMMPGNTENPAYFADCMYRYCPEKRYHICALGEKFIYENTRPV